MVSKIKSRLLIFLLVFSLLVNAYFVLVEEHPSFEKEQAQEMQAQINDLQKENENLKEQLKQDNESLKSYSSQLDYYRTKVYELENNSRMSPEGLEGFATLQGPAVFQKVTQDPTDPLGRQSVSEEGALMNLSVEIRPGKGRVLVQTTPLMGVVFQDAANTAVYVAENKTGKALSSSDVIFGVQAEGQVPGVDGPSAGALMTLLTISAIDNKNKLNNSITLTGTIDDKGNIGAIGGVLEKAQAAKAGGKTLFLIPRENSKLVTYKLVERHYGGITLIEREPEVSDAKEYIETNVGIRIEYVDSIEDVLRYL